MHTSLKNFYNLTLADPLFAAEGLDLENAHWALDDLRKLSEDLEHEYRKQYRWFCFRYPFVETLHPIRFLEHFLKCEALRRKFIDDPSEHNAQDLLRRYKKTVSALRENADAYREALIAAQKAEPFPKEAIFHFISENFSFTDILRFIDKIIENTHALEIEILNREHILSGKNIEMRDLTALPITAINEHESGPVLPPLFQKVFAWTEEELQKKAETAERYGPIFYKCAQFDDQPTLHHFYFYLMKHKSSERLRPFILMADRYYFVDIKKFFENSSLANLRITWKTLYELGERYEMRSGTQPYVTFDLRYWSDLATIVDTKWRRPILRKNSVLAQKSSLFDILLWGLNYTNRHFLIRQQIALKNHGIINPLFGLFINRSYISLYYLLHNQSVWRLKDSKDSHNTFRFYESFNKTLEEVASEVPEAELKMLIKGVRGFRSFQDAYGKAFGVSKK